MNIPQWVTDIFQSVDAKDTAKFASFLTEDSSFIYANFPPINGKPEIEAFVDNFLKSVSSTEHRLENYFTDSGHVVTTGMVTYTRHNGTTYQVKFCNIFEMAGDKIKKYDIFIDSSQLYT
ncbi:MAG: nuclear transport factor 2 family protein [Ignavibacteria bacterium]|nr:nuclear transport factor 2 family protein [Ignavibacteria bacterium]